MPDFDIDFPPIYTTISKGEIKVNGAVLGKVASAEVHLVAGNSVGSFTLTVSNIGGVNTDSFSINDDIEIYFPDENDVAQLVLKGFIDNIDNVRYGVINLRGQDYTGKLHNVIINDVYTNREVSTIVSSSVDGVAYYVAQFGIDAAAVQVTTATLDVMKVSQKTGFQLMTDLLDVVKGNTFYVDVNKSLHFEPQSYSSTGKTLTSGTGRNINTYSFVSDFKQQANRVTVYGAPQYFKTDTAGTAQDTLDGDGSTKTFQLTFTPESPLTLVKVGGVTYTEGGGGSDPTKNFSVDYALSKITFVTAPAVGTGNIQAWYNYNKSILASDYNAASIATNGLKETVIFDQDLTSTQAARTLATAQVKYLSDPRAIIRIQTSGKLATSAKPGQSVVVNIPKAGLVDAEYNIAELTYVWGKNGYKAEWTLATVDLNLAQVLKSLKQELVELKRRGLTKTVATEQLIQATIEFASITTVGLSRIIDTSFIAGVSLAGQHGSVAGDKRTYLFA